MVVAMIALFVALSGSAVALQGRNTVDKNDIRKDAVRSKQVKNESLKGIDLKNGTVVGEDVGDGSLNEADLAANSVDSSEIADNAVKNSEMADNAVGANELKGIYAAVNGVNAPTANTYVDGSSSCNQGDAVLGGGFSWLDGNAEIHTNYSTPDPLTDPNRWIVRSKSSTAGDTLFTWAVCLGA